MLLGAPRAGGWDRGRVGERLQATLAGLQELQVLREKQRELVRAALAMPQRPAAGGGERWSPPAHGKEQRLEDTLSALKEQLSRLRRQDVGLKSHLDQLDQRICELRLDVSKTSSDYLDSDSRPSSGFYDLSDGGSCSLSNSCTSVYSESVSSSHTSLLPSSHHPRARLSIFDYRPKSADETTVHAAGLQQQGPCASGGYRVAASTDVPGTPARAQPRPVSTGDLERLVPADAGFQRETDPESLLPLSPAEDGPLPSTNPKFQSDLVSKNGADVYPYPSPLHVVALQSPLFSLVGTSAEGDLSASPGKPPPGAAGASPARTRAAGEAAPGGYIQKLLQLTRCRGNGRADASQWVSIKTQPAAGPQRLIITPGAGGVRSGGQLGKQVSFLQSSGAQGKLPRDEPEPEQEQPVRRGSAEPLCALPATQPPAAGARRPARPAPRASPLAAASASSTEGSSSPSRLCQGDSSPDSWNTEATPSRKPPPERLGIAAPAGAEGHAREPRGEFVRARFVPAESHQVQVRFASSKARAAKVKRRSGEKAPRAGRQPLGTDEAGGSHGAARSAPGARGPARRPSCSGESVLLPAAPELRGASAGALGHDVGAAPAGRKQRRRWQSSVEISAEAAPGGLSGGSGVGAPGQPARRAGVPRTGSARARCRGQRHGAYTKSEPEPSAERAALFRAAVAETSEGEVSDVTANRFADGESSDSDSDGSTGSSSGSLALDYDDGDESDLIWPEGPARQPGSAQVSSRHLPPVPKICRIKASKALKKKIRRFQPASLKVMTMV